MRTGPAGPSTLMGTFAAAPAARSVARGHVEAVDAAAGHDQRGALRRRRDDDAVQLQRAPAAHRRR